MLAVIYGLGANTHTNFLTLRTRETSFMWPDFIFVQGHYCLNKSMYVPPIRLIAIKSCAKIRCGAVWPHENQCTPAGTYLNEHYSPVKEQIELRFFYKLPLSPMVLISLIWNSLRYYSRYISKISLPLKPDLPPKPNHCPPHETVIFNYIMPLRQWLLCSALP